jgi:hypothetical protein
MDHPQTEDWLMKYVYGFILVLLISISGIIHAQPSASAPLGRLFFTPEKRVMLERQQISNIQETQTLEGATMSLDGVVQRSSGKSTVWINGRAQDAHDVARTGITVRLTPKNPGHAQITPAEEPPSQLKVGETINRATRERNDRLGGGIVKTPASRH